jgi:hypothetical protein
MFPEDNVCRVEPGVDAASRLTTTVTVVVAASHVIEPPTT